MKLWMLGFLMGSLLTTGVSIAWEEDFDNPLFVYPVLPYTFQAPPPPGPRPLPPAFPPQPLYNWQSPC